MILVLFSEKVQLVLYVLDLLEVQNDTSPLRGNDGNQFFMNNITFALL